VRESEIAPYNSSRELGFILAERQPESFQPRENDMQMDYFDQAAATWDDEPRRIALMKAVGEAILLLQRWIAACLRNLLLYNDL
jgi:hypothetical protein